VICSNYDDGTLTAASCTNDLGFWDIGYNIVFLLRQIWPSAVDWVANTQIPIVRQVAQLAVDAGYLTAFEGLDMTDPVTYSQHWSCATIWTALPNALIAMALIYVLWVLLGPLLRLFATLLVQLFYPLALALLLEVNLLTALFAGPLQTASAGVEEAVRAAREPTMELSAHVIALTEPYVAHQVSRLKRRWRRGRAGQRGGEDEQELVERV